MAKKKKLTKSMFRVKGKHAKMKIKTKKKKLYYFRTKIKPEKAKKIATSDGADILGVSKSDVKASKPRIKYDFYCLYDADLEMTFLRINKQDFGVNDQVKGALIGKEVVKPKKKEGFYSVSVDVVELFEIDRNDGMILDGKTGGPARALEKLLKGPGKKKATPSWIRKNTISPGKFKNVDKVVKTVAKMAKQKPSGAKRITSHTLTFNKLYGYYVPIYYVRVKAGANSQTLKINAVDGSVSVKV